MRIAANIGPTGNWKATLEASKKADELGFDAVSFLDHYQSGKPEWAYVAGWSIYGALALATSRVKLVPMVICRLNYLPGVLAKETAMLDILSGGRFELGIGAGDFFEEMYAWGIPVPKAGERIEGLKETVEVVRKAWTGEYFDYQGNQLHIQSGLCRPAPSRPLRVVVGVGNSPRLLHSAIEYADEINVYENNEFIQEARKMIDASGREVELSTYGMNYSESNLDKIKQWEQWGVDRAFLTFWEPFDWMEGAASKLL